MAIEKLATLTEEELYDLAREHDIVGRTEMTKEELIDALSYAILSEGQVEVEAEKFDLGSPIIGMGASDKKLPSSLDMTEKKEQTAPIEITKQNFDPYFDGEPLPDLYGDDKLVLMPKNPQWVYAYWEISQIKIENLKSTYGDKVNSAKPAIRVYDVTLKEFDGNNANSYFDIELPNDVREWFIGGLNANASYIADFGFKTANGEFITALRSQNISTPSDSISENVDEEWMIVEEYFRQILQKSSQGRIVNGRWVGGMGASGAMLGSSEEMMNTMLRKLFMQRAAKREKLISTLEREMGSISVRNLSSLGGSSSIGVSSFSVSNEKSKKIPGNIEKEDDFWLMVGTELILYGATEADATVTVMGKEIKLREDGTFSFRYALPVGHYDLPVVAVSKNGKHTREITPIVDRTGAKNNLRV